MKQMDAAENMNDVCEGSALGLIMSFYSAVYQEQNKNSS